MPAVLTEVFTWRGRNRVLLVQALRLVQQVTSVQAKLPAGASPFVPPTGIPPGGVVDVPDALTTIGNWAQAWLAQKSSMQAPRLPTPGIAVDNPKSIASPLGSVENAAGHEASAFFK